MEGEIKQIAILLTKFRETDNEEDRFQLGMQFRELYRNSPEDIQRLFEKDLEGINAYLQIFTDQNHVTAAGPAAAADASRGMVGRPRTIRDPGINKFPVRKPFRKPPPHSPINLIVNKTTRTCKHHRSPNFCRDCWEEHHKNGIVFTQICKHGKLINATGRCKICERDNASSSLLVQTAPLQQDHLVSFHGNSASQFNPFNTGPWDDIETGNDGNTAFGNTAFTAFGNTAFGNSNAAFDNTAFGEDNWVSWGSVQGAAAETSPKLSLAPWFPFQQQQHPGLQEQPSLQENPRLQQQQGNVAQNKRYYCEHNKRKNQCRICGENYFCEHNKRRNMCRICGKGHCQHGVEKSRCPFCKGSGICEHLVQKRFCKLCRGSAICVHNLKKYSCRECGGLCVHNKIKYSCQDCCQDCIKKGGSKTRKSKKSYKNIKKSFRKNKKVVAHKKTKRLLRASSLRKKSSKVSSKK